MRQLRRSAVVAPTLRVDGIAGRLRTRQIQQFEQNGVRPSSKPPDHWRLPDVLGALCTMQGHVCAYCGADIGEVGGTVDHFRPKTRVSDDPGHGGYWWLLYDHENYLLSCNVCNEKYKRDWFPLEDGALRFRFEDRDRIADERRVLLNPTVDQVEDWISVDWENAGCRLVANRDLTPELSVRVCRTISLFRFNLRPVQRKKRMDIQRLVVEKVAAGKAEEVRDLAIRYSPHSIVAKQILQATAPHVLPTAEEELTWLLEQIKVELLLKLDEVRDPTAVKEWDEKEAKELFWALAMIWKDPPAGTPDSVAAFLDHNGLRDAVEDYFRLL